MSDQYAGSLKQHTTRSISRTIAIIPCLNESKTIRDVILKTYPYVDTILVIDDGSTDSTALIAKDAGAKVIIHDENKGKGSALRTGFKYAMDEGFDFIVTLDGDGQHNPEEIPQLLIPLLQNTSDITLGFRSGNRTEMPFWRRLGKRTLDYLTSFATGGHITDSQSGFRGFNRKAVTLILPKLTGDGFSTESEQLIFANELNLMLSNIPISCKYEDLSNTSKQKPVTHGLQVVVSIMVLLLKKRPFVFLGMIGLFLGLLGVVYVLYAIEYAPSHLIASIIYIELFIVMAIIFFLSLVTRRFMRRRSRKTRRIPL